MQPSSVSISDALSAEEICPLCLDHYTAADECTCVVCRAPSCPSCAESIDADGAMRCYACRPAPVFTQLPALSDGFSLPRPIPAAAYGAPLAARALGEPPPLPFPLTSSPYGIRELKPKPAGSVFVGLPPVPSALASTLHKTAPSAAGAALSSGTPIAPPWSQQARIQLALGRVRAERAAQALAGRGREQWLALCARLPGYRLALLGLCQALIARGRQLPLQRLRSSLLRAHGALRQVPVRASLARLSSSGIARQGLARLSRLREHGAERVRALRASDRMAHLSDARLLAWTRARLARAKLWTEGQLARPLAALSARLLPRPEKPVQRADRTSSISL
ncbi:MAG TPA: hypothetical protein VFZ61_24370 [Polyangiales bacterium]